MNLQKTVSSNKLKIINIPLNFKDPFNVSLNSARKYIKKVLNGAQILFKKNVKGLINCPIDKKLFKTKIIGVTELLSKKNKIKNGSEVMLIYNKNYLSYRLLLI